MADDFAPPPAATAKPKAKAKPGPKPLVGWRADLAAFWSGFSRPSFLAFGVFCGSAAASLILCLWFFSEASIAGWYGRYLPRSGLDAEGFATREALKAAHEDVKYPRLFLLGTSTVAQAVGSGKELEKMIKDLTGQEWRVVVLTTPLQSPTDQFALIDRALETQRADSPPVVVAVGFGLQRLRWTPEQTLSYAYNRRLGLRSDWEDAEVRALGGAPLPRTGSYLPDNRSFVLVNGSEALLRLVLRRPAVRLVDQYAAGPRAFPSQEMRDIMGTGIRDNFRNRRAYFAQIDRLATNLATRPNVDLVLIEEPLSPGLIANQHLGAVHDRMSQDLAEFALSNGIGYWPVSTEAQLTSADYFDDLHVLEGNEQDLLRAMLARHMKQLLAVEELADGQ